MKNKKKQQVFQSTTFTYFSSKSELVPDSVRFIQDGKKYEVIFNTDLGWTSNIMRFGKPHQQDMILGIIIGDEKKFRILQGNTTIEWTFKTTPYENIII